VLYGCAVPLYLIFLAFIDVHRVSQRALSKSGALRNPTGELHNYILKLSDGITGAKILKASCFELTKS